MCSSHNTSIGVREKFVEIFQGASEKVETLNIPLPTLVPGEVPVCFKNSPTASQVRDEFDSVES